MDSQLLGTVGKCQIQSHRFIILARAHAIGDKILNFRYIGRKSAINCGPILLIVGDRFVFVVAILCFSFLSISQIGGAKLNGK